MLVFLQTKTAFTTVTRDELSAACETVDRKETVICTSLTTCHLRLVGECFHRLLGEHGRLVAFLIAVSRNQGCTEGTHDTGDVRTDSFPAGDKLEASKNRIVVEGSALYDDILAK